MFQTNRAEAAVVPFPMNSCSAQYLLLLLSPLNQQLLLLQHFKDLLILTCQDALSLNLQIQ